MQFCLASCVCDALLFLAYIYVGFMQIIFREMMCGFGFYVYEVNGVCKGTTSKYEVQSMRRDLNDKCIRGPAEFTVYVDHCIEICS